MSAAYHGRVRRSAPGVWLATVTRRENGRITGAIASGHPTQAEALAELPVNRSLMGVDRGPLTPVGVSLRMVGERAE